MLNCKRNFFQYFRVKEGGRDSIPINFFQYLSLLICLELEIQYDFSVSRNRTNRGPPVLLKNHVSGNHVNSENRIRRGLIVSNCCTVFLSKQVGHDRFSLTFMRKNVILVRRSTVALRSCNFSLELAGKLFLYMDKSSLKELCNVSNKWMNLSFCKDKKDNKYQRKTTKIRAGRDGICYQNCSDLL